MSRAVELAARYGARMMHEQGTQHELVCFREAALVDYYHAARAEALREAADKMDEEIHDVTDPVRRLRAMADREGK